jgi:hypothetical protein
MYYCLANLHRHGGFAYGGYSRLSGRTPPTPLAGTGETELILRGLFGVRGALLEARCHNLVIVDLG